MNRHVVAAVVFLLLTAFVSEAFAQRRRVRRPRRPPPQQVTVPFNVGVAPTALFITGPVQDDKLFHTAMTIDLFAVIDQELIRKFANRIPREYRAAAMRQEEVRYKPAALGLVPASIIVSPKIDGYSETGMYGLNFKPIGVGTSFGSGVRLGIQAGLDLTYMFIHSDTLPSPTHFLRPGADLRVDLEFKITKSFLMSLGWKSALYPPQEVGGSILEWGELDQSIWHIGQAYLMFHQRVPVTRRM